MSSKAITEYDAKRLLSFIENKAIIDDPPFFAIPDADILNLADLPKWMDSTNLGLKFFLFFSNYTFNKIILIYLKRYIIP